MISFCLGLLVFCSLLNTITYLLSIALFRHKLARKLRVFVELAESF
ncbi:MAG: hypothetical protein ACI90A_001749, partial [Shewanella sp.]